jgi:mannose-1-phosphate guanylyltransferase/phosphomannomutase
MPDEFEQIAARHGGRVIRTKVEPQALTKVACDNSVLLAADGSGQFIFPQFQPASDGLMAAAKLLEFLTAQNTTLSEVLDSLPTFHMAHQTVSCPWEAKGNVMRRLHQHFNHDKVDMTDGIKIRFGDSDWVLLLPDPDHPLFQVYAEGVSPTKVSELVARFVGLVIDLQSKN